jgi:hypothetical protein
VFHNVESHKKSLLEELCALDRLEEEKSLVAKEKLWKTWLSLNWRKLLTGGD